MNVNSVSLHLFQKHRTGNEMEWNGMEIGIGIGIEIEIQVRARDRIVPPITVNARLKNSGKQVTLHFT
uniref:Uncharacterized protein n=1 Tax=Caenorhabditis japonica TaxID=281687 RepID=A0A8R1IQ96_CAEJA